MAKICYIIFKIIIIINILLYTVSITDAKINKKYFLIQYGAAVITELFTVIKEDPEFENYLQSRTEEWWRTRLETTSTGEQYKRLNLWDIYREFLKENKSAKTSNTIRKTLYRFEEGLKSKEGRNFRNHVNVNFDKKIVKTIKIVRPIVNTTKGRKLTQRKITQSKHTEHKVKKKNKTQRNKIKKTFITDKVKKIKKNSKTLSDSSSFRSSEIREISTSDVSEHTSSSLRSLLGSSSVSSSSAMFSSEPSESSLKSSSPSTSSMSIESSQPLSLVSEAKKKKKKKRSKRSPKSKKKKNKKKKKLTSFEKYVKKNKKKQMKDPFPSVETLSGESKSLKLSSVSSSFEKSLSDKTYSGSSKTRDIPSFHSSQSLS
ncbi:uncharacterized protein LOC142330257 isoform X2 [Lycorma delicatula]|uniref:uncharacterized protein LOC142330257 isoform X2 n=1 Tax=Lycorma delicatula TaxID=130591 RepID=UPI003F517B66